MRSGPDRLTIGDWSADRSTGRIERGGVSRTLEPKVMDLLFLLADEPKRVFAREALFEALWPGVTVGDDSLARAVSKLRTALEDDARAPLYVETIPKRGYRLVAVVGQEPAEAITDDGRKTTRRSPALPVAAGLLILLALVAGLVSLGSKKPAGAPAAQMSQDERSLRAKAQADMAEADRRPDEAGKSAQEKR